MSQNYIDSTDNSYGTPGTGDASVLSAVSTRPRIDAGMESIRLNGVPQGAQPQSPKPPEVLVRDIFGNNLGEDLRVKLRVPPKYLTELTQGGRNQELVELGGIVFPYTPQIQYEVKAEYTAQTPTHSNFPINFYKNSSIGNISINGKFTVQNIEDAKVYVSTKVLLKALTKMRFGGLTGDADSGSPPPVCRLDAYGEMMLDNVPVAVSQFRIELPENVDYFTFPGDGISYGPTSVPVSSTINIVCVPMYSRAEMQEFNVTGYLRNAFKGRGYI
ncbi:MAG: hypothetical protein EBU90_04560 [Proteobacteria bacterium]|nr:hypothetical protein [Pseudomonadota bacterium]